MIIIKDIFEKSIDRKLEGVIKVDKQTEEDIFEEVNEYVVTKELKKNFGLFFEKYTEALKSKTTGVGVWISGFFGSGKSHFLKILSYILGNKEIYGKKIYQYFEEKIDDPIIVANMKAATDYDTDVMLFNIDNVSDADARNSKEPLVKVFNKQFNQMQGFSANMPWLAELERQMQKNGTYDKFKAEFEKMSGTTWDIGRDDYYFEEDNIIEALANTTNVTIETARNIYQKAESNFELSIDTFVKKVKEYIDSKGKNHNVIFMIDEMGQYIGSDSSLMLGLQTITERLGTECQGNAWVFVTSQEAVDTISKNLNSNEFSKIQGRFDIRMPLSSSNVDEVIKKRVLAKNENGNEALKEIYGRKGAVIKNLVSFSANTPDRKYFKSADDYAEMYPFLPYQFNLLQLVYKSVRNRGASGKHLSEGERSLLSAFKESAMKNEFKDLNYIISFSEFYDTIETFLDHDIRNVMTRAENNENLVLPEDLNMLKILFLLKDLDNDMPANIENLTTLSLTSIDEDKIELNKHVKESLRRLCSQNLIQRDGENYIFLTNDEQEINREISATPLDSSEIVKFIGNQIFNSICDIKYKYNNNIDPFGYNQMIDDNPHGQQINELGLMIYTPYYGETSDSIIKLNTQTNHSVAIKMADNSMLVDEIEGLMKLDKYIRSRNTRNASTNVQKIINLKMQEINRKTTRVLDLITESIEKADIYANGSKLDIKQKSAKERINEAFKILVETTYTKLNYINKNYIKSSDLQALATTRQNSMFVQKENQLAIDEVKNYVEMQYERRMPITFKGLSDRYKKIPYGWNEFDITAVVICLLKNDDIKLELAGNQILIDDAKLVDYLTKRDYKERVVVKLKIKTSDKVIGDLKRIFLNIFAKTIEQTTDDELKNQILNICKKEENEIQIYSSKYPSGGYFKNYNYQLTYVTDIPYQNSYKYPGYDFLQESKKMFASFNSITDTSTLFNKFIEAGNALEQYKSDMDIIKNFTEHQIAIFETSCNRMDIYKQNQTYLKEIGIEEIVRDINEILSMDKPYSEIYRLPDLCQEFDTKLIDVLDKESEPICKDIDTMRNDIAETYKQYNITQDNYNNQFDLLKEKATKSQIIATILNVKDEATRLHDALINTAISQYEQKLREEQAKNPTQNIEQKTIKRVVTLSVGEILNKTNIKVENEQDVENLVNKLKNELNEKLKDNIIINIK